MSEFAPHSTQELSKIIAESCAENAICAIIGNNTKASIGHEVPAQHTISTRNLSGIVFYAPDEMVIRVKSGTTVSEIEDVLAQHGQFLTFEPMDYTRHFGATHHQTIGGIIGANVSGSRRIFAGAARDSMIGVEFINGSGEIIKSGGRVMKNVTGYDFTKLLTGAYGTLGVLSEITLKLLPRPKNTITLKFSGLNDAQANALMCAAFATPFEVSGAAHYDAQTFLRLEGLQEFIAQRAQDLKIALAQYLTPNSQIDLVKDDVAIAIWQAINRLEHLPISDYLWQISIPPAKGAMIIAQLKAALQREFEYSYDWSGGRIFIALERIKPAEAQILREMIKINKGHVLLLKSPNEFKKIVPVFQPQAEALKALSHNIKRAFDPAMILNTGRMWGN